MNRGGSGPHRKPLTPFEAAEKAAAEAIRAAERQQQREIADRAEREARKAASKALAIARAEQAAEDAARAKAKAEAEEAAAAAAAASEAEAEAEGGADSAATSMDIDDTSNESCDAAAAEADAAFARMQALASAEPRTAAPDPAEQQPTADVPPVVQATGSPEIETETEVAVAPVEEPVAAAPAEEPVAAAPVEEPVAAAPVEEPVAAAPVEGPPAPALSPPAEPVAMDVEEDPAPAPAPVVETAPSESALESERAAASDNLAVAEPQIVVADNVEAVATSEPTAKQEMIEPAVAAADSHAIAEENITVPDAAAAPAPEVEQKAAAPGEVAATEEKSYTKMEDATFPGPQAVEEVHENEEMPPPPPPEAPFVPTRATESAVDKSETADNATAPSAEIDPAASVAEETTERPAAPPTSQPTRPPEGTPADLAPPAAEPSEVGSTPAPAPAVVAAPPQQQGVKMAAVTEETNFQQTTSPSEEVPTPVEPAVAQPQEEKAKEKDGAVAMEVEEGMDSKPPAEVTDAKPAAAPAEEGAAAAAPAEQQHRQAAAAPPAPAAPLPQTPNQPAPGPAAAGSAAAQQAQIQQQNTPASATAGGTPQPQMRELKVEDALLYLDQVKLEFGDRPRIYNEFLEIMKNFKAQEIDTPGVIRRVSTLFRGYNNLILGFNTFLPEGYKIELKDLEAGGLAGPPIATSGAAASGAGGGRPSPTGFAAGRGGGGRGGLGGRGGGPGRGGAQGLGRGGPSPPQRKQVPLGQQQQQGQGVGGSHAVEFDHAIAYVTTIKKRFANDPRTYQTFLEILHTYQKEQRGIKEVLEQVSNLFADHPDLLKEFTFFLPDAVQEQAKERLARAAAEAEERKRIMLQAQAAAQAQLYSGKKGKRKGQGDYQPPPPAPGQKFIDMTQPHGKGMSPGGMRKRAFGEPSSPAEYVYNAAVERQFFDAAKEALTVYSRDGGQAWAEFLKCLDMYAQEVLSRSEMLGFVEPLLGKRNIELFEEFKRILANAGTPTLSIQANSWHSVPLSEIDFSRCRRCSPSYRALPRDYPAPPCSERSITEKKILNDVWVSLPVGSEESYTFRHMRKNQHEEILFRIEDERFEIDMCIDSNATTLLRLEPIAEEIVQLNSKEIITPKFLTAVENGGKSAGGVGFGGKKFQYTLDKRILSTIHRHSIVRIYGDAGQEMFDLLFKNPTMAVPVVVKRLRQKDREWKAARDVLNLRWKELAEVNYYKSIDHQSMTWKTTDKRATSTRTLVAEIKDRASNNGEEGEAAITARKDKMKEEYGSFYEVTMGRYRPKNLDLTKFPAFSKTLFTPHMSFIYDDCSWAQKDAFRILIFALERGSISPMDKERCHRVWRDFLAHIFGLSLSWMQDPALSYASTPHSAPTVVSNDGESGEDDDDDDSSNGDVGDNDNDDDIDDGVDITEEIKDTKSAGEVALVGDFHGMGFLLEHQPIPLGTHVSTTYGEGIVKSCRKADGVYNIQLNKGGTAYLRADSILCTVDPVDLSTLTTQLRESDKEDLAGANDRLVIGTQSLYLFFRLHQLLVQRLSTARALAYKSATDKSIRTHVEQMIGDGTEDVGQKRYNAFLSMVYGLIEGAYASSQGGNEGGKFEERVRCLLGQGAFELATMDKLINHIQKHLQHVAGDETMQNLIDIYRRHAVSGGFKPSAFKQEAAYVSEGENMFAFQYCPMSTSDKSIMYYEFLGDITESESSDDVDGEEDADTDSASGIGTDGPSSKRQRRA